MGMYEEYDEYFLWLCANVDADLNVYSELLWNLMDIDFYWVLELDESRATEGLMLREEFYNRDKEADWIMLWNKPCSVLEALIALARRMDNALVEVNAGNRTSVWFWMFLANLNLKQYNNARLEVVGEEGLLYIRMVIEMWLNRVFDVSGSGSIFPLDCAQRDQTRISMVYQMYDYIFEHFEFEEG